MMVFLGFIIPVFTFLISIGFFMLAAVSLLGDWHNSLIFGGIGLLVVFLGFFVFGKVKG